MYLVIFIVIDDYLVFSILKMNGSYESSISWNNHGHK